MEAKEGGVNDFIYASIIGVCVPGRLGPKLFYSPPFQLFCTEQCTIFVSTVNYGIHIFMVDEFSRSWFVLAKLKLRVLVRGAHLESKLRVCFF